MPEADELGGVGANQIQKGILGGLGEARAHSGLGERALVQHPDTDDGVLVLARRITGPGRVEPPGEPGPGRADLVKELVVLKCLGARDLLHRGLHGLLYDRGGFGQCLG